MHVVKSGLRALGIAESYSGREQSTLAGVVMRKDLRIDGAAFARMTVGGSDATDAVIRIFHRLARRDINLLMISGSVVAWYNIIDPAAVQGASGLPVIVTTYEESDGLEEEIRRHFPDDDARLAAYRRLGGRIPVRLHSGYTLFIRPYGLSLEDAARLCNDFTREGRMPEPVRVARLIARAVVRSSGVDPDDHDR
ncbi:MULTISPECIES: DUF99 family protein [unclassified Methanoculleus]|uniref:endonuclease dU n=1 Tax=unclassified Methanoculleus TaxID=2619537 RepID=UPI0025EDD7A6|nr:MULTISPECIES: DUF99 family protein [unclassified Methanoculleus]